MPFIILLLILTLSACAPQATVTPAYPAQTVPTTSADQPYPAPETLPPTVSQPYPVEVPPATPASGMTRQPVGTPVREPEIHTQARAHLAQTLTENAAAISIVASQAIDWPDSCLGVYQAGTACLDVITPGYIITAQVGAQTYTLHSNTAGTVFYTVTPP